MKSDLEGFVLAGGKSSRMKTDKAFLKFEGETFLERAAGALLPVCGDVKIIINENQKAKFEQAFPLFQFVFDIYAMRGALGGIHAALKNCKTVYAVILACDLPFVEKETIETLIEAAQNAPENVAAVVPRQHDRRVQPLCAVYRTKTCLPVIEKLIENGNLLSMKNFLNQIETQYIEIENSEKLFFNVNRPEDFQKLNS